MSGPDAPQGWHQWGGYNHYVACCCAGFSHLSDILQDEAVEIQFQSTKTGRKSLNTQEALELRAALSEMLNYPESAIEIISLDSDGDSVDAVVQFLNSGNIAGSTMVQVLNNTPQETFEEFGIENFEIQTIHTNDFATTRDSVSEESSSSSSSDDSASSLVQISIFLIVLLALFI